MRRGEKEGFLILRLTPPEDEAIEILDGLFVTGEGPASEQVKTAIRDCYKRLLSVSMETEMRLATKKAADVGAIRVFAENSGSSSFPRLWTEECSGDRSGISHRLQACLSGQTGEAPSY